jgi:drug/metabolite transporter (DMT)-like permease
LFRAAGRDIGPLALNLLKNTVGLTLLLATLAVLGGWESARAWEIAVLVASGVVGIAMADTLFLFALNEIGAARTGVISAGYPLSVILLSYVFLGDRLIALQWAGALAVVAAIVLASVPEEEDEPGGPPASPRRQVKGLLAGLASVVLMAVGIVMAKPALDCVDVVWASTLRLGGGNLFLALFCALRKDRSEVFSALLPSRGWRFAVPGGVIGTWLAYLLWLGGVKYADVSVAAVLNQLVVVYIAVLAVIFLGERMTRVRGAAVVLGVTGSIMVALGASPEDGDPVCDRPIGEQSP